MSSLFLGKSWTALTAVHGNEGIRKAEARRPRGDRPLPQPGGDQEAQAGVQQGGRGRARRDKTSPPPEIPTRIRRFYGRGSGADIRAHGRRSRRGDR